MAKRSKVSQLPPEIKDWLDKTLIKNNFGEYDLLEKEINALLEQNGADFRVSRSGLHRYGSDFEERLSTLKLVTEQARAVVAASPDEEDAVNQALVRLTQEKLFSLLLQLEVDPSKVNLSGITRSIAELARASISVKDFAAKVRSRTLEAANDVEKMARSAGLTDAAADEIKKRILGIAG